MKKIHKIGEIREFAQFDPESGVFGGFINGTVVHVKDDGCPIFGFKGTPSACKDVLQSELKLRIPNFDPQGFDYFFECFDHDSVMRCIDGINIQIEGIESEVIYATKGFYVLESETEHPYSSYGYDIIQSAFPDIEVKSEADFFYVIPY